MKARAIVFEGVGRVALRPVEIPEPGAGEVLIAAEYTVISPGTELRCLAGKQAGAVFPFIPGYSLVGRVVARGSGSVLPIGTRVYCSGTARADVARTWGGQTSHAVQSESEVYPVAEGTDPAQAVLAHLAAIAYRGVRLSRPAPHETVAVIGLGAIGSLSARLFAATGARVVASDLSPFRVSLARQAGIEAFVPEGGLAEDFAKKLPGGADVVVDATGHEAVLPQSLAVAKDKPWNDDAELGPRVVVQGSYPDSFRVPYMAAFMKELSLLFPRDTQPRDVRAVLDLIARGRLPLDGIVSDVRRPEAAPETYAELTDPGAKILTAAFRWGTP